MNWQHLVLACILSGSLADCALAGIFSRKAKASPQRAQELIGILKSDPKESKRASAVEELASFDPQTHPELLPMLLEALRDPGEDVRYEAVQALGKLRPVSQEVGQALEQAQNNDAAGKVRRVARTTLWQYYLAGYRSGKQDGPPMPPTPSAAPVPQTVVAPAKPLPTTKEPPLAEPRQVPRAMPSAANRPTPAPVSREVPRAMPSTPTVPRAMPSTAAKPTLTPIQPPALQTPPATIEQGPMLNPPE